MLNKNTDFVICENASFMNAKAPASITRGICVGTKNYIFYIPTQTVGFFPMLQTFTNHRLFEGVAVFEGTMKLIGGAESVLQLEESLTGLLENNTKYVHDIASYNTFVISGLFVKNNMRLIRSRFDFYACVLKPNAAAKEFRDFYGR
jgi:hypothetical protein